jgi:EAL domain-containing protein (putative c-di-GMP-specific phosphodiesterase class I)/ActR/RegA family two-component response regulator
LADNKLLIMDDDLDISSFFRDVAEGMGFNVRVLNEPKHFFATVTQVQPDVIIMDLQMPNHDGIELLRGLGDRECKAKIFIASGLDGRVLTTAGELGTTLGLSIVGTFCKPIELDALRALLRPHCKQDRVFTADELAYAIDAGQLVVHYLPQVSHKGDGRWIMDGVEALVRWQHEEHGLIQPSEFIGLAEESGLIVSLTDYVFRTAMDQTRIWFHKGHVFTLGLNLSAEFLTDLEFPDRLVKLIREKQLDCSMVSLELTETSAFVDPELGLDILARLRVKHINVCLDDFGVGHSSLTHLYRMPFNELKLDNAFINDMRTNEDARHIVEGLIYLAHKLKMRICAEGVEDEATFRMLEAMQCDKMQGYYFGPALPAREIEQLVRNWNSRYPDPDISETA